MAELIARIDVVATIIHHNGELLLVHSPLWGAFTLPMTKLRHWQLGLVDNATRWERGDEAAMRNVAECLGSTSLQQPGLLLDVGGLRQSDRSGEVKYYQFQIYNFPFASRQVAPGITSQWLTPAQILEENRQPISPTARFLITNLQGGAFDRRANFPPVPGGPRTSTASIAVIRQPDGGQRAWLCQWNSSWGRYFLIGGHAIPGESPEACMVRELGEELHCQPSDFTINSRERLPQYEAWSTGAWQQTTYAITTFDVILTATALSSVCTDAGNRWLTAREVDSERCADGKLLSPTVRTILQMLGELKPDF